MENFVLDAESFVPHRIKLSLEAPSYPANGGLTSLRIGSARVKPVNVPVISSTVWFVQICFDAPNASSVRRLPQMGQYKLFKLIEPFDCSRCHIKTP